MIRYLLILAVILLMCPGIRAANYYIDPSGTADPGAGTLSSPWRDIRSLNAFMNKLLPGDTVFFKRGELFTGPVRITCSGNPGKPIVFAGYGPSAKSPVFLYRKNSAGRFSMFDISESKWVEIYGIEVTDDHMQAADPWRSARVHIAFSINGSSHISISRCRVSHVGIGINIVGNNNTVVQCRFDNLRMVNNTKGGNDDYGANPVVIAGAGNLVGNCVFVNARAKSHDYGYDGGCIEMFGSQCRDNVIRQNLALNCHGFMEFGSDNGGEAVNTLVEGNTVLNCGSLLYINNDGDYAIKVRELVFRNNHVIQTSSEEYDSKHLIKMTKREAGREIIVLDGNIFWLPTAVNLLRESQFTDIELAHRNNIYYIGSGKLNLQPASSEKIFSAGSGDWQKKPLAEIIRLNAGLYPFKYLLTYWSWIF